MNPQSLIKLKGYDVAIQKDFFGNESIYITKSKGIVVSPTLDDMAKVNKLMEVLK